jgi:hypothetical protein
MQNKTKHTQRLQDVHASIRVKLPCSIQKQNEGIQARPGAEPVPLRRFTYTPALFVAASTLLARRRSTNVLISFFNKHWVHLLTAISSVK